MKITKWYAQWLIIFFLLGDISLVFAEPPPWAPAHGYRKNKAKGHYDKSKFGIEKGHCYREPVGEYLGRSIGQTVGENIKNHEGRVLAEVTGILLGQVFDRKLGNPMDKEDYFCTGQTLELAKDHQRIEWNNPYSTARYWIEPINSYRKNNHICRDFISKIDHKGRVKTNRKTACRQTNGSWLLY